MLVAFSFSTQLEERDDRSKFKCSCKGEQVVAPQVTRLEAVQVMCTARIKNVDGFVLSLYRCCGRISRHGDSDGSIFNGGVCVGKKVLVGMVRCDESNR